MRKALLPATVFMLVASCSAREDVPKAEAAVGELHQKLNSANFDAIYGDGGPEMKKAMSHDDFVKFVSAVHRNLGDLQSGKTSGWKDTVATGGHFVTLNYASTYEPGGADENFCLPHPGRQSHPGWLSHQIDRTHRQLTEAAAGGEQNHGCSRLFRDPEPDPPLCRPLGPGQDR
jgi:hypothetical protein